MVPWQEMSILSSIASMSEVTYFGQLFKPLQEMQTSEPRTSTLYRLQSNAIHSTTKLEILSRGLFRKHVAGLIDMSMDADY